MLPLSSLCFLHSQSRNLSPGEHRVSPPWSLLLQPLTNPEQVRTARRGSQLIKIKPTCLAQAPTAGFLPTLCAAWRSSISSMVGGPDLGSRQENSREEGKARGGKVCSQDHSRATPLSATSYLQSLPPLPSAYLPKSSFP